MDGRVKICWPGLPSATTLMQSSQHPTCLFQTRLELSKNVWKCLDWSRQGESEEKEKWEWVEEEEKDEMEKKAGKKK